MQKYLLSSGIFLSTVTITLGNEWWFFDAACSGACAGGHSDGPHQ